MTLCDPMDCSPPGSSVHGISQAGILAWTAISYSRGLPDPRIEPASPALTGKFFTIALPGKPLHRSLINIHLIKWTWLIFSRTLTRPHLVSVIRT